MRERRTPCLALLSDCLVRDDAWQVHLLKLKPAEATPLDFDDTETDRVLHPLLSALRIIVVVLPTRRW